MAETSSLEFDRLMNQARGGDAAARGELLARYGEYLNLLVRLNLGKVMQAKASCSDVVQETFLQAEKNFARFRGMTERELMSWLRRILAAQIAQQIRYYRRGRRNVALERRLSDDLDRSAVGLGKQLIDKATSPSLRAARREREVLLADALARLKPEHREVVILRNLEELSFEDVARRMGRSAPAVKSLWVRALASLRRVLGELESGSR